jgi:serine/threonine-protein kinase
MSPKVILKVVKGSLEGQEFVYEQRESLLVGKGEDCHIRFEEKTVSRYHCYIEINPPVIVVRDFFSLNGTFLNGKKIGQRNPSQSPEEAQKSGQSGSEFQMKQGDSLRLGNSCEIVVSIEEVYDNKTIYENVDFQDQSNIEKTTCEPLEEQPENVKCAQCGGEMAEIQFKNDEKQPLCKPCYNKFRIQKEIAAITEAEAAAEAAAAAAAAAGSGGAVKQPDGNTSQPVDKPAPKVKATNNCSVCGALFTKAPNGITVCPQCQDNPLKIVDYVLHKAKRNEGDAREIAGYRNIKLLGEGGMGQVWLVEDEHTGEFMALKVMLPQIARDELSKKMFMREACIGCALEHENVVRHHKCGSSGEMFFILMELCKGGSVDKLINSRGGSMGRNKEDIACATSIMLQALDGLYHTHNATVPVKIKGGQTISQKGVVHRDFKPGNIFIANEDHSHPVAKVADFGLAKAFDASGYTDISRQGDVRGSLYFMPRQQITNCKEARPEVDAWAATASYYNMLTGFVPKDFRGASSSELFREALHKDAVPIRNRNGNIPEKLANVIDISLIDKDAIGIHQLISTCGKKFNCRHPEMIVLKNMIWEALPPDLQKSVWDILPPFTKKNIEQ